MFGRTVEAYEKTGIRALRVGDQLTAGTYFVEVTQGTEKKLIKIVKAN